MNSSNVRENIVNAIQLDMVGPQHTSDKKYLEEVLSVPPSSFYLTGFLVPYEARAQVDVEEDDSGLSSEDQEENTQSSDDINTMIRRYPSSIGLSFLVKKETTSLEVQCRWGEYEAVVRENKTTWKRTHHEKTVKVDFQDRNNFNETVTAGIELTINLKTLKLAGDSYGLLEDETKSVSLFLVNRKNISGESEALDNFFLFQAELEVMDKNGFCPRPNLRALESTDLDDSIADLQFSSVHEYATGHGVAAWFDTSKEACNQIKTAWIPCHEVEGVNVPTIPSLNLGMEFLEKLQSFDEAKKAIAPLISEYKKWILQQKELIPIGIEKRQKTGEYLLLKYDSALKRIEKGIELLIEPKIFEAFKLANSVMAISARKRKKYEAGKGPEWRTFQLAFFFNEYRRNC